MNTDPSAFFVGEFRAAERRRLHRRAIAWAFAFGVACGAVAVMAALLWRGMGV